MSAVSSAKSAGGPTAAEMGWQRQPLQTAEDQLLAHLGPAPSSAKRQVQLSENPEVLEVEHLASHGSAEGAADISQPVSFSMCGDDEGRERTDTELTGEESEPLRMRASTSRRSSLHQTYAHQIDWAATIQQSGVHGSGDNEDDGLASRSSTTSLRPRSGSGRGRRPSGTKPPIDVVHRYMSGMTENNQRHVLEHMVRQEREISYLRSVIQAYEDMSVNSVQVE